MVDVASGTRAVLQTNGGTAVIPQVGYVGSGAAPYGAPSVAGRSISYTNAVNGTSPAANCLSFGSAQGAWSNLASGPFTVFFWANYTAGATAAGWMDHSAGDSMGWAIANDPSPYLNLSIIGSTTDATWSNIAGGVTISAGWNSYAVVFTGASYTTTAGALFYVGGANTATTLHSAGVGTIPNADTTANLFLGSACNDNSGATRPSFGGNIELCGIWNRALAPAEIASLHTNRYQLLKNPASRKMWVGVSLVTPTVTGVAGASAVAPLSAYTYLGTSGVEGDTAVGILPGVYEASGPMLSVTGNTQVNAVTLSAGSSPSISGVAATSSVGTVSISTALAISGTTGTSAVGTITANLSIPIVSATGTTTAGALSMLSSNAVTGVAGASAAGSVVVSIQTGLVGAQGASSVGQVIGEVSSAVTGVVSTSAVGALVPTLPLGVVLSATGTSASGSVTAAIPSGPVTGVAGAGAVGNVTTAVSEYSGVLSATGTSAAGSVQTPLSNVVYGVFGSAMAGSVVGSPEGAVSGISATSSAGAVGLKAYAVTLGAGSVGYAGTVALQETTNPAISGTRAVALSRTIFGTQTAQIMGVQGISTVATLALYVELVVPARITVYDIDACNMEAWKSRAYP